jgi:DNA-binding FadR family transcriptional regulator
VAEESRKQGVTISGEMAMQTVMADVSFHLTIMKASGNRRLMGIVSSMRLMSRLAGHNWSNPEKHTLLHSTAHTLLDHVRIYRALAKHDAKAARYWMRRHLRPRKDVAADLGRLHRNLVDAQSGFADWPESVRQSLREMEKNLKP